MKRCSRCREVLPLEAFYWDSYSGKHTPRCRTCHGLGERTCRQCGVTFVGSSSMAFCSSVCRRAARPPTFRDCAYCRRRFGPLPHLAQRFCSKTCAYAARPHGARVRYRPTPAARRAHDKVRRAVANGRLVAGTECENCGSERRLEAAHWDYARPLDVRWLCVPCHRSWDAKRPKGGAVAVRVVEPATMLEAA